MGPLQIGTPLPRAGGRILGFRGLSVPSSRASLATAPADREEVESIVKAYITYVRDAHTMRTFPSSEISSGIVSLGKSLSAFSRVTSPTKKT